MLFIRESIKKHLVRVTFIYEEREKLSTHCQMDLSQKKRAKKRTKIFKSQEGEKMAAVFPRACYKCGEVGHLADNCEQQDRLCYNCHQPGHESSDCTEPKMTTHKQCYLCGDVGHVQSDCPTQEQGSKCYNCGNFGHISKNCNAAGADSPGRKPVSKPRGPATTCYKCGGPNHFARDCQANTSKCYACGKSGHISRDCHSAAGGSGFAAKACYNCGETGHISRECTA